VTARPFGPFDGLEAALGDLGDHLDLGPGDTEPGRAQLVANVIERLPAPVAGAPIRTTGFPAATATATASTGARAGVRTDRRLLVAVAAAIAVLVVAGLLAVTPTREAIARWVGIGGVRITTDDPLPDGGAPVPGAPATGTEPATGAVDLDAIDGSLPFPIRTADPSVAGELRAAAVDWSVAPGLVELRYDDFTLVELGSRPSAAPVLGKVIGPGTTTTAVTVDGRPGVWLSGATHQVGSVDPDGELRLDTVRRAGNVLVWEDGGVTYRIEGALSLEAALEVATGLR